MRTLQRSRTKFLRKHYEDNLKKIKIKRHQGKQWVQINLLKQVLTQRCLQLLLTPKHLAEPNTFPLAFNGTDWSAKCSLSPIWLSCCQLLQVLKGEQELSPFKLNSIGCWCTHRTKDGEIFLSWGNTGLLEYVFQGQRSLSDFWRPCRACTGTKAMDMSAAELHRWFI